MNINNARRAGSLFGGLLGGLGGGVGTQAAILSGMLTQTLNLSAPTGVAIGVSAFLAVAGSGFALARALFTRSVSKTNSQLERLVDRLEARLQSPPG